ncbi:MAG TPA: hypothetical protein VKD26_09080 [Streptosporangiaceae bacterium]|nr:hypothetical protein [Streptosporangiaceae bacterium]
MAAHVARGRRPLVVAAWATVAVALSFCYLRVSQTEPADSYGAVFTLQAWDMLHGNLLLHGWWLSDVSFYTTELPEYMLVDLLRGLSADVVHVAAAITYTLLVMVAALLAIGPAKGKQAAVAALITAGIMLSPQLGNGTFVLLLAPDHVGTCVPVLLAWLIVDRARPRWYGPVAVGLLLAWALVADQVVLLIGVLPLVAVCVVRVYQAVVRQRQPLRSRWYEVSLAAAAVAAAGIAAVAVALITARGGFVVWPVARVFTSVSAMPHHLLLMVEGLLLLFGADFFGHGAGAASVLPLVHLAGFALAVWATCAGVRRFRRCDDLVVQILVVAIPLNLVAFLLWDRVGDITMAREMAAVLPYGAVLAGRLLAGRLASGRPRAGRLASGRPLARLHLVARPLPLLSVVLLGYLVNLGYTAAHPPMPPQNQRLATWLAAHHFRYGIGTSWLGSGVTVASGGRVQLRPVAWRGNSIAASEWESQVSWFDPRRHDANFAVLVGDPPNPSLSPVRATFGPPARTYHVGPYTVLVWNGNLLTRLR